MNLLTLTSDYSFTNASLMRQTTGNSWRTLLVLFVCFFCGVSNIMSTSKHTKSGKSQSVRVKISRPNNLPPQASIVQKSVAIHTAASGRLRQSTLLAETIGEYANFQHIDDFDITDNSDSVTEPAWEHQVPTDNNPDFASLSHQIPAPDTPKAPPVSRHTR